MDKKDLTFTDSEEEEDDEMMLVIVPALYSVLTRTKTPKTPCRTSKLTGPEFVSELLQGHPRRCHENLRMEAQIFLALSDYLRTKNLLRDSRGVRVEEQLAIFIYMLAHNAPYRTLCERFQHRVEDVSDEIKIYASDVFKDATNREFFLCYESRLRGLWLKKEVEKLGK